MPWKPLMSTILSLTILLLTACHSELPAEKRPGQNTISVTRDDPTLAPGCRPRAVAERLLAFIDALNKKDASRVATFFGQGFRWFSITGSPGATQGHFTAYSRRDAVRYVTQRGDFNLALRSVEVGSPAGPERGDFGFELVWGKAINGQEERWQVVGKGAINCATREIDVWSMAVRPHGQEEQTSLCPGVSEPARSGVVIACARIPGT